MNVVDFMRSLPEAVICDDKVYVSLPSEPDEYGEVRTDQETLKEVTNVVYNKDEKRIIIYV